MLSLTDPDILCTERFGSRCSVANYLCICCNKELTEDEVCIDRFGRSFCGEDCSNKYYGTERGYC